MSDERDELAVILHSKGAYCGSCGYEDGTCIDCNEILDGYADAILAAGYRKPRQVTTAEELEALPVGSVVIDREGMALQKTRWDLSGTGWNASNGTRDIRREELERDCFPATVLHEGAT